MQFGGFLQAPRAYKRRDMGPILDTARMGDEGLVCPVGRQKGGPPHSLMDEEARETGETALP